MTNEKDREKLTITRYHYDNDGLWQSPTGSVVRHDDYLIEIARIRSEAVKAERERWIRLIVPAHGLLVLVPSGKFSAYDKRQIGAVIDAIEEEMLKVYKDDSASIFSDDQEADRGL